MHDMKILEDNWKKYQIKKRKPWYLFLSFLLIIILIIFLFLKNNFTLFSSVQSFLTKISNVEISNSKSVSNYSSDYTLLNGALTRLELIDKKIKNSDKSDISNDVLVDIPILEIPDESISEEVNNFNRKKIHLNIIESTSVKAYKDVEKRFYESNDIDDGLFLARSYYKKGNYKKSAYWSLQVNKLNTNVEESLLIFVKSKIKLGHKNEALGILISYIKKSNSKEAKDLLLRINNNKF